MTINEKYKDPIKQRILKIRTGMISRCTKTYNTSYHNYGGRGIKVCEEWMHDRETFYRWAIKNGYKEGLQLDRINTNGDYEPSNCRWVTSKQNNNNRRDNIPYTMNGETHTLSEWCDIYNVPFDRVRQRVRTLGWDLEKALRASNKRDIKYATINGITKPIYQWADEAGVNRETVRQRLAHGYSVEDALRNENFMENGFRTKRKLALYGKYSVKLSEVNKDNEQAKPKMCMEAFL